jgi:hypothetical protein
MQPTTTTRGQKRLTLRRIRPMLVAAATIALAVLTAACSTGGQQPAPSNSATGVTVAHHNGDGGYRGGRDEQQRTTLKLTTVAEFPVGYFLENVAVRADGSMLVTELSKKGLWYVPAPTGGRPVQPVLIHTFDQPPFDIAEAQPNVFYVDTDTYLTTHQSYLYRIDLRGWKPGRPVPVQQLLKFPYPISDVNGSSVLGPNVILVVDSADGLIWRVDLSADGKKATARVWLQDPSMKPGPPVTPPQPGINGIKYDAKDGYVYYTSTFHELFMRVRVDPRTLNPASAPELVAQGHLWDDFNLDENAGVAYITTHRQNTIERVPLDPHSGQTEQTVAGMPFNPLLAGPSAFAWGPSPGDLGSVAYITTDGGATAPPAGIVRPARLLRAELS